MIRVLGLGMMLLFLASPEVLGQKGKKKNGNPNGGTVTDGTPAEYEQLKKVNDAVGKLAYVDQGSGAKSLTLDIQYFYPAPGNYNGNLYQRHPNGGYRLINGAASSYQNHPDAEMYAYLYDMHFEPRPSGRFAYHWHNEVPHRHCETTPAAPDHHYEGVFFDDIGWAADELFRIVTRGISCTGLRPLRDGPPEPRAA